MKRKWMAVFLFVAAAAAFFLTRPCLFGQTRNGFLFVKTVSVGTPVTLRYRHSVMKTEVWEYLEVNEYADGLVAVSTKYQSYGAGLPSLVGQGNFRRERDWFILDIHRDFPTLSIRNGVTNEGVLTVGDAEYKLYEAMPLGSELYLYAAPLWRGYWMKKEIR